VQLAPEDVTRLEEAQAQVMDAVLTHLREQERQNIIGKEGSERLRFELVQIIENIIRPARVHTIYFKELVLQ
jgi:flagellar basal body-associated protein FliL